MTHKGWSPHSNRSLTIPFPLPVRASLLTNLLLLSGGAAMLLAQPQNYAVGGTAKQAPQTITTKVIYVNPNIGTDTVADNSQSTPYRTIAYAMQQASSGTAIQLASGSYTNKNGEIFPIVVKQGVILRGDESTKGQTIKIIGGGYYISPTLSAQNVTVRAEKDSEISGLSITNPNTRGTALWIESSNPTVKNNTFSNSNREGVFLSGTANPKIEDNIFTKNLGNGISIAKMSTGEIRNNVIDNTGIGIVVSESASPAIAQNRILKNRQGVDVGGDATPLLRNNIIENNRENGVVATGNAGPNLGTKASPGQNRIRNNGQYDIYNVTRNNTIFAVGNDIDLKRISGRVDFVNTPATRS